MEWRTTGVDRQYTHPIPFRSAWILRREVEFYVVDLIASAHKPAGPFESLGAAQAAYLIMFSPGD